MWRGVSHYWLYDGAISDCAWFKVCMHGHSGCNMHAKMLFSRPIYVPSLNVASCSYNAKRPESRQNKFRLDVGYTGWPKKSKPPPIFQKNRITDCQRD